MTYAPEYNNKEKRQRIIVYLILGGAVYFFSHRYFFPAVSEFANAPHCYTFFGLNGTELLWPLLFNALPVICFIIVSLATVPTAIKSLKQKQFPPKNVKVYKPTKIKYGFQAKLIAIKLLIAPVIMCVFVIWANAERHHMPPIDRSKLDPSDCQIKLSQSA